MKEEVVYMGNCINKEGISPVPEKVKAIQDTPVLRNVSELKSFLGILNYFHRYIPDAATLLEPLHYLLRKDVKWTWGKKQSESFKHVKDSLCSKVLIHYDTAKILCLMMLHRTGWE